MRECRECGVYHDGRGPFCQNCGFPIIDSENIHRLYKGMLSAESEFDAYNAINEFISTEKDKYHKDETTSFINDILKNKGLLGENQCGELSAKISGDCMDCVSEVAIEIMLMAVAKAFKEFEYTYQLPCENHVLLFYSEHEYIDKIIAAIDIFNISIRNPDIESRIMTLASVGHQLSYDLSFLSVEIKRRLSELSLLLKGNDNQMILKINKKETDEVIGAIANRISLYLVGARLRLFVFAAMQKRGCVKEVIKITKRDIWSMMESGNYRKFMEHDKWNAKDIKESVDILERELNHMLKLVEDGDETLRLELYRLHGSFLDI